MGRKSAAIAHIYRGGRRKWKSGGWRGAPRDVDSDRQGFEVPQQKMSLYEKLEEEEGGWEGGLNLWAAAAPEPRRGGRVTCGGAAPPPPTCCL